MSRRVIRRLVAAGAAVAIVGVAASGAHAYFERVVVSSRVIGLGGAFVAVADDPAAVAGNTAGLAGIPRVSALATYQRPFGVSDLDEGFVAAVAPVRVGVLGVSWHRLALRDATSEDLITVAFARDLIRTSQDASLSVGASVDVARVAVGGPFETSETKVSGGAGVLLRPFPIIGIGYSVRNVTEPSFDLVEGGTSTKLRRTHAWGVALNWHNRVTVNVERTRNVHGEWQGRAGVEVRAGPNVRLRSGLRGRHATGGFGINWKGVGVDVGVASHEYLGATYIVSVGYRQPGSRNPYAQNP